MIILILFHLLFKSLTGGMSCAQTFYELKDLEVLEKEKSYDEFLTHANSIRPSERTKHWKEMYQNMASYMVLDKIKIKDFTAATFKKIELLTRTSALMSDEFFQLKTSIYAEKYFSECFLKKEDNSENCSNELFSHWELSKQDPDSGLSFATILEKNDPSYKLSTKSWPLYEKAVKDPLANFYCKKPNVQRAIMNRLYSEAYSPLFKGNYSSLVSTLIPKKCFNELIVPLKELLKASGPNGLEKEMALNILEAENKLSREEIDFYAILFLLDGPVVGDKMNLAWKKVEDLGQDYSKRKKLLKQIEALPLMPDKIFSDPELPRHKAIINLFAKNFPEYLDFYSSSCLKAFKNSGPSSLNINSTFYCEQFFKFALKMKKENKGKKNQDVAWISDLVEIQFSAVKKWP